MQGSEASRCRAAPPICGLRERGGSEPPPYDADSNFHAKKNGLSTVLFISVRVSGHRHSSFFTFHSSLPSSPFGGGGKTAGFDGEGSRRTADFAVFLPMERHLGPFPTTPPTSPETICDIPPYTQKRTGFPVRFLPFIRASAASPLYVTAESSASAAA